MCLVVYNPWSRLGMHCMSGVIVSVGAVAE